MASTAAIVTVAYDSAAPLRAYWADADLPEGVEWIVVDNASRDASAEEAERLGARVVRAGGNLGFSAGNNLGAAATDAEVLLFVNPDVRVTPEGLLALVAEAREHGGIVAPQLVNLDGSLQENGRGAPYLWRKVAHRLGLPDLGYSRYASRDEVGEVVWVTGAALAIRRADFDALGGWDEDFFLYDEDVDLGLRALRAGLASRVLGSVRWTHEWERASVGALASRRLRLIVGSSVKLYRKHPYALVPLGRSGRALKARDALR